MKILPSYVVRGAWWEVRNEVQRGHDTFSLNKVCMAPYGMHGNGIACGDTVCRFVEFIVVCITIYNRREKNG